MAHGAVPGMKGLGIGLIHPLITPAHLLLLLALGLLAGLGHSRTLALLTKLFMPSSTIALLLTAQFVFPSWMQIVVLLLALSCALLVAWSARLTDKTIGGLFAATAIALGLDSGVSGGATTASTLVTLAGTWIGLNLFAINFAYYASVLPRKRWVITGVRVVGSWIAAICFLVIAFSLKDHGLS